MPPRITAWEAPALLGLHRSLSEHDLYNRLLSEQPTSLTRGVSSYIGDALLNWASQANEWPQPIQRTVRSDLRSMSIDGDIETRATASECTIDGVATTITALHIAGFVYSREWGRSGIAPDDHQLMAQWVMMHFGTNQHAIVILHDKSTVIQWIDRNEDMIKRLKIGLASMARRIAKKDPPPIFQERTFQEPAKPAPDTDDDVATLAAAWLNARQRNANAQTSAKNAATAFERATARLKAAMAPGSHHDIDGLRIFHNAQSGRLLEEKINAEYF